MLSTALCFLALLAAEPYRPAIWPEYLGDWKRIGAAPAEVADGALLDEYGLQAVEKAEYTIGPHHMFATGYRFRDAIAGYAGYLALRPAGAKKSDFDDIAVQAGESVMVLFGNYVFRFDGGVPDYPVYEELLAYVPKMDLTALTQLKEALPAGSDANSERYVLGPESLARFVPRVPPSVAAFRLGSEGMAARYGPDTLAVFGYPDAAAAQAQSAEFGKLPGAAVRRAGRYVAVAFDPGAKAQVALAAFREPVPPAPPTARLPQPGAGYFTVAAVGTLLATGVALGMWLRRRPATRENAQAEIRLKLGR